VPAIAELGYANFDFREWHSLVAPAGTPRNVIKRLTEEVVATLRNESVIQRLGRIGLYPTEETGPEALGQHIRSELARWSGIIRHDAIGVD
jgi:tripartite-type tricarboxylate transporter receptor subunit TctC